MSIERDAERRAARASMTDAEFIEWEASQVSVAAASSEASKLVREWESFEKKVQGLIREADRLGSNISRSKADDLDEVFEDRVGGGADEVLELIESFLEGTQDY